MINHANNNLWFYILLDCYCERKPWIGGIYDDYVDIILEVFIKEGNLVVEIKNKFQLHLILPTNPTRTNIFSFHPQNIVRNYPRTIFHPKEKLISCMCHRSAEVSWTKVLPQKPKVLYPRKSNYQPSNQSILTVY